MKYCPNCGYGNEEYAASCMECGTALGGTVVDRKKRRSGGGLGGKPILKIGAVVAAAALAVSGAIIGVKALNGNNLSKAYSRTSDALVEEVYEQNKIETFSDLVKKFDENGKYSVQLVYENDFQSLMTSYDYSRSAKQMAGELVYADASLNFEVDYSVEDDVIQISCPDEMEDVYGFSVKKMGKVLSNSLLSSVLPFNFDTLRDVDFFARNDFSEVLNQQSDGKLEDLKDTVKITYLEKRNIQLAGGSQECKMYQVTWDEKALNELFRALEKSGPFGKLAVLVEGLLPKIDADCRCYINEDNYIVGIDLVSLGSRYVFLLEGEKNPWDQFSLTVTPLYGDSKVYNGKLNNAGNGIQLYLKNQDDVFLDVNFSDEGDFSVYTAKFGTIITGKIVAESDCAAVELNLHAADLGAQKLTYQISRLEKKPEQLAKYYVDLLDMSLADWQRLLLDMGISVK